MTKAKPKVTIVSTKSKAISKFYPKFKGSPPSQSLICVPSSQDLIPLRVNHFLYDSHLDNSFIQEHVLAKTEGDLLGIRTAFRTLGWEPILDIEPVYVTRSGYTKGGDDFSLPREARDLGIFPTIRGASDRTLYASCKLTVQNRSFLHFLYCNVLPTSCVTTVRSKDIYLMSKLIKGRGPTHISWAGTVIAHMLEFVRNPQSNACIPYPCVITKFLVSLGVKILDDEYENKEFSNLVSIDTLKKWHFRLGPMDG
ncbi:hypothetical protein LIER_22500 [Lithospermum erythrorhizon]|uniref:Uncharacterized protein n=1 Tax=Lithospermum erythrorhizon TaxID=34254 RepID=A0AAV3QXF2_LITER